MPRSALLFVEGFTEEVFYGQLKSQFFARSRVNLVNLEGNWNINQKILDKGSFKIEANPNVDIYCFVSIDRESRDGRAPINLELIDKELREFSNYKGIELTEAVQDIESWFFEDIENIYAFLRAPHAQRNPNKFRPAQKLNHKDLMRLFRQFGREYRKGYASENFLSNLDKELLHQKIEPLRRLCAKLSTF